MAVTTVVREVFFANTLVFYILAASIVELIAAGVACEGVSCTSYYGYAVAVGAVSTGLTLIQAILCFVSPRTADKISPGLSTFLVLWWIPGAGVPTFKLPFVITGNGYFACWVAFFASLFYFQSAGLAYMTGNRPSDHDAFPQQLQHHQPQQPTTIATSAPIV